MVAQPSASPLWFELLGPVRGRREGADLDLGPTKQRAVLAVLLLHRNAAVPTSRIVEAVWGDEPPLNGANVVQKYVAGLRRAIEPAREARAPGHLLSLDAAGYTLAVGPDQLDLDAFDRLRRSGLRHRDEGRPGQALRTLRDAVDIVGGEPLAGLPGDWFAAERARIVEEWTDALEACVELEVALGRHEQVLPELRGLVARFPLRERLRGALMLALYRAGRPAEALAAFQSTREALVDALGVEPGPALQELHARMLRSDPSVQGELPAAGGAPLALVPPAQEGAPPAGGVPLDVGTAVPEPVAGAEAAAPARRTGAWALLVVAAVACVASLGLASPFVLVAVAAATWVRARRTSWAALALLVAWGVGFTVAATTGQNSLPSVLAVVALFAVAFAAIGLAAHVLLGLPSRQAATA